MSGCSVVGARIWRRGSSRWSRRSSGRGAKEKRLIIRANGRVTFGDIDRIDWVEADGNYVRIHAAGESHLVRDTMANLHARLGEIDFFRLHRSRLVNVDRIRELKIAPGGDYDVVLTTGETLGLSRLYREALENRLAGRTPRTRVNTTND